MKTLGTWFKLLFLQLPFRSSRGRKLRSILQCYLCDSHRGGRKVVNENGIFNFNKIARRDIRVVAQTLLEFVADHSGTKNEPQATNIATLVLNHLHGQHKNAAVEIFQTQGGSGNRKKPLARAAFELLKGADELSERAIREAAMYAIGLHSRRAQIQQIRALLPLYVHLQSDGDGPLATYAKCQLLTLASKFRQVFIHEIVAVLRGEREYELPFKVAVNLTCETVTNDKRDRAPLLRYRSDRNPVVAEFACEVLNAEGALWSEIPEKPKREDDPLPMFGGNTVAKSGFVAIGGERQ